MFKDSEFTGLLALLNYSGLLYTVKTQHSFENGSVNYLKKNTSTSFPFLIYSTCTFIIKNIIRTLIKWYLFAST